jgi:hypothetical protein
MMACPLTAVKLALPEKANARTGLQQPFLQLYAAHDTTYGATARLSKLRTCYSTG